MTRTTRVPAFLTVLCFLVVGVPAQVAASPKPAVIARSCGVVSGDNGPDSGWAAKITVVHRISCRQARRVIARCGHHHVRHAQHLIAADWIKTYDALVR